MLKFIESSVEYKKWGVNLLTISFIATVFFTILQGYALLDQSLVIWNKRSAESVSGLYFLYSFIYLICLYYYGVYNKSLAMIINALLWFPNLLVLFGIWRFKGIEITDSLIAGSLLGILVLMILAENKDRVFSISLAVLLFFLAVQLKEMINAGSRGAVSLNFLFIFLATNIFWFIYGVKTRNWPLKIFNALFAGVFVAMICLYFAY